MATPEIKLDIYPNPTSGTLFLKPNGIDIRVEDIQIYNYMGENCFIHPIQKDDVFSIDLHDLNNGIYWICISSQAKGSIHYKISKN
jgi:hypothetical protein